MTIPIGRDEVLKTLAYGAVFKYPLSFYQLGTFLLGENNIDCSSLRQILEESIEEGVITVENDRFFLSGNASFDWVIRAKHTRKVLEKFKSVFDILGWIPWIKLLAVTGSFAAFNPTEDDDLDIFIITQKKRLWLTRLFVVLFLKLLGKYRTDKDPAFKMCPNIYISEDDLSWFPEKRNLYIAHEIVMMHPIINRDNMYFRFLKANAWIFEYFANFDACFLEEVKCEKKSMSKVGDLLERLLRDLQLMYMKKRQTTEVTTDTVIHFNRGDSTDKILNEFGRILSDLG